MRTRFLLPAIAALALSSSSARADSTADLDTASLRTWQALTAIELAEPVALAAAPAPELEKVSKLPDVSFPAEGYEAPPKTAGEAVDRALEAGAHAHYSAMVVLALMALVGGVRVASATVRNSKLLGWVSNFALGFLGTLGLALEVGHPLSWTLVLQAVIYSLTAAGGWALAKDAGVAPAFMRRRGGTSTSPTSGLRREV